MMKRKSGQILILILLIVVVALAIGLSVASRNITNLRISTQTEQSQRSFTAAEGGIEDVLSRLSQIATNPNITTGVVQNVQIGNIVANVNVKGSTTYESQIDLGSVGQIDLKGATGSQIQIEWAKVGDPLESAQPASLEITQITEPSVGSFSQTRWAFAGVSGRVDETGFASPSGCTPQATYTKCTVISLQTNSRILRIRPFWTKATIRITCIGVGCTLPIENYDVTSTATTDLGVTRRVEVTRTALPALPTAFDYVLFSQGDIVK